MKPELLSHLKSLYESRPFKPIELILDDGRKVRIDKREFIGWSAQAGPLTVSKSRDSFDFLQFDCIEQVRPFRKSRGRSGSRPARGRRGAR